MKEEFYCVLKLLLRRFFLVLVFDEVFYIDFLLLVIEIFINVFWF